MTERPIDPEEHAKVVKVMALSLTRLEQTTRRLAFATNLKDDAQLIAQNDEFLKRVRGWFAV